MSDPIYHCSHCHQECDDPVERFEVQHHPYGDRFAREVLVATACPWCGTEGCLSEVKPTVPTDPVQEALQEDAA